MCVLLCFSAHLFLPFLVQYKSFKFEVRSCLQPSRPLLSSFKPDRSFLTAAFVCVILKRGYIQSRGFSFQHSILNEENPSLLSAVLCLSVSTLPSPPVIVTDVLISHWAECHITRSLSEPLLDVPCPPLLYCLPPSPPALPVLHHLPLYLILPHPTPLMKLMILTNVL